MRLCQKAVCSLAEDFGDARFASLNHKNSGLPSLKQFMILNPAFNRRVTPKMLNVARKRLLTGASSVMKWIFGT